jgi:hypothetical protein
MPTLPSAPIENPGETSGTIELTDLREALFNGEALQKDDLDVLETIARDKNGLVKRVLRNKALIEKAGNPDQLLYEIDRLEARYREEILEIEALKSFEKKVEQQSWGSWAIETVKSTALFPVRHPVWTLLILAATAAGIGYLYYGLGETLLALIPNYSGQVVDAAKKGVKAISEHMSELGKTMYKGDIPFTKKGLGIDQVAPQPYDVDAPLFTSPNILTDPSVILTPPSVPPIPGASTVPVPPFTPDVISPIGRELF